MLISILLGLIALGGNDLAARECLLELTLVESIYPLEVSREGYLKKFQVQPVLENKSSEVARVLFPGPGSTRGLRMPFIWWEVEGEPHEWPEVCPPKPGCGNIFGLTQHSVYHLAPGTRSNLSRYLPKFPFDEPGNYRARLRYLNQPDATWKGIPYEEHEPGAMELARTTVACDLSSDWITVIVPEDREASVGNWYNPLENSCTSFTEPLETVWIATGRGVE